MSEAISIIRRRRNEAPRPMIEAIGLGKRFRAVTAVHDLSFTVGDGEIFGILGPNGAGKTTTVRMLAGLIAPSEGTARINGLELGPRLAAHPRNRPAS